MKLDGSQVQIRQELSRRTCAVRASIATDTSMAQTPVLQQLLSATSRHEPAVARNLNSTLKRRMQISQLLRPSRMESFPDCFCVLSLRGSNTVRPSLALDESKCMGRIMSQKKDDLEQHVWEYPHAKGVTNHASRSKHFEHDNVNISSLADDQEEVGKLRLLSR